MSGRCAQVAVSRAQASLLRHLCYLDAANHCSNQHHHISNHNLLQRPNQPILYDSCLFRCQPRPGLARCARPSANAPLFAVYGHLLTTPKNSHRAHLRI